MPAAPTPGPWMWNWRPGDESAPASIFAMPRKGHAYAIAMCPRYQTKERWAADAALIVRAVKSHDELLAALHAAREYIDGQIDVVDGSYGEPAPNRAMVLAQEIDAAIAKATGGAA